MAIDVTDAITSSALRGRGLLGIDLSGLIYGFALIRQSSRR